MMQSKLGLYCVLTSVLFTASILTYGYTSLFGLYEIIVELTDVSNDLSAVIEAKISGFLTFCALLGLLYVVTTVLVSIYYTHRFVGPTVAFKRHIVALRKGEYGSRVVLRKTDAFADMAEELNMLAADLERMQSRKKQQEVS